MTRNSGILAVFVVVIIALIPRAGNADNAGLNFTPQQYAACITNVNAIPEENITFEFWFRTRQIGGLFGIVASDPAVRDYDRCVTIENGRVYHYLWADQDGTEIIQSQDNGYADGEWHHFALVLETNRLHRMYLDGELAAQGNLTYSRFDWADRFVLGYGIRPGAGQLWLNGDMDEFRFWDAALSQEQIRARMSLSLNGDEDNLIFYYRCDEGQGQSVADDSPNNFPLRLGSAAGQDNNDPRWIEQGAPLFGGELTMSLQEIEFGPVPVDTQVETQLLLANTSEEEDEYHRITFTLTDRGDEPFWLAFEPEEGTIDALDTLVVTFTVTTEDLEPGEYERTVRFESNAANVDDFEIPVHVFVVEGFGELSGTVTAASDDSPLEGATVAAFYDGNPGPVAVTDAEGFYDFADLPAWTYNVTASHPDFIAFTEQDVVMEPEGEVELNFSLLHSVFVIQPAAVNAWLMPDERREIPLMISNPGNGPLEWTAIIAFPQGVDAEPWEMRQAWSVGDTVGDDRIGGVAFAEDRFFVAGSAGNNPNAIYILNRDGSLQGSFVQPGDSRYGMDDLAWDGELLWGSGANYIYAFTTDGDSVTSFRGPNRTTHAIAWDPQREVLWTSDITSRIISISCDGEEGADIGNPGMNISGLAFWQADPDGYQLYVSGTAEGVPTVRKLNVATSEWLDAAAMELQEGWSPQGVEITREFDPYSWVFLMLRSIPPEQGGDRIEMWQLLANTSWITYEPLEGVVEPEGELATTLTLDASGVPEDVEFEAQVQFTHNGFGQADTVQVNLTVSLEPANEPPSAFSLLEPANETRYQIEEVDTVVAFTWGRSIDPNPDDEVTYRIWYYFGVGGFPDTTVDSLSYFAPDTFFSLELGSFVRDSLGNYNAYIEWWVEAISGQDSVISTERWWFSVQGPGTTPEDKSIPIEFGLHALYPNPFNARTAVQFGVDKPGLTTLKVFDLEGRVAAALFERDAPVGNYRLTWDAANLPSGVYLVRLESAGRAVSRKAVLMK